MNVENTIGIDKYLHSDESYLKNRNLILCISIVFLMIRFGAIIPDVDKLLVKGLKILSMPRTIAVFYLVWAYLYFIFYQRYWRVVEKEITNSKERVFKEKIAHRILSETHERHGHSFDCFEISYIHLTSFMRFYISYSPVSFLEYGEEEKHDLRSWIVDLKLRHNRKYIMPYLAEVYLREPIVTAYLIPFIFPIIVCSICMVGNWAGSLTTILSAW